MNSEIISAILTVVFAAVAGGVTNAVAVWMLFHPHEPPTILGWRISWLQGAIPKNKTRMAAAIGRAVGTKLLTGEDLARTISEPSFRNAFEDRLGVFLRNLLEQERGSIQELLPPELAGEVRAVLSEVMGGLVVRLEGYLDSEEFEEAARRWAQVVAKELADQPLGDSVLTPEREQAVARAAERWLEELVEGGGFAEAVQDYLDRGADRLLVPGRTFQEILPVGLIAAVERAIAGYLPIVIERLGGMLDDPKARKQVERILHELLDRFMADMKFHQRLVAALLITPDAIDRVLKAIERDGATKIAQMLQDDAIRDAMARGVNNAIVDFLRKDVTAVLGRSGEPSVEQAKQTIAQWVLNLARDEQTRRFLIEKLVATLNAAEQRTWGDIFKHVPPERLADGVVQVVRSARARELYRDAGERALEFGLHRPIGRVARHFPDDTAARLQRALDAPIWSWVQEQIPPIAQRIDIARRVEEKILDFPTVKVEELIKGVTDRELRRIVDLGWVLGALIGTVSAGITLLF